MYRFLSAVAVVGFLFSCSQAGAVTTLVCVSSSTPLVVHAEGLTEAVGDFVLDCSGGQPGTTQIDNVTLQLNVNATNRIDAENGTDIIFTIDSGSGPVQVWPPGVLMSPNTVTWDGVPLTLSPTGTMELRIANVRVNATEINPAQGGTVMATISVAGQTTLPVNQPTVVVATTTPSLFSNFSSELICAQQGATVPSNLSFAAFIAAHAVFSTTRITEGWVAALTPSSDVQNFDADSGDRIVVSYTGLAPGAKLYVPVAVAGSDALQPTAGGDFGLPASGGKYAPSALGGSLLLSLVSGADANGAGGAPLYTPGAPGSGAVAFDKLSELPVGSDGGAYAVYDVMDAADSTLETAQFPTFLSVPPIYTGVSYQGSETVTLAPVSTVGVASASAPIPRFVQAIAPDDCAILGDCGAPYFPHLAVESNTLAVTEPAGVSYATPFELSNTGSGQMNWTSAITYQSGSGWLYLNMSSGSNGGELYVNTDARHLTPGTYQGAITFDGGTAGKAQVAVTLTVEGAATPSISSVSGAANPRSRATAGSLAAIMGANFAGPVAVSFDGFPGSVQYTSNSQVNVVVPGSLAGRASTELVLSSDGVAMAPLSVPLAEFSPAIFAGGILNEDGSANDSAHPAASGSQLTIRTTGLASDGVVTVRLGRLSLKPRSFGPANNSPGTQEVILTVPQRFAHGQFLLQVCESAGTGQPVCSPFASLFVAGARAQGGRSAPVSR
jgi:uncharacterized protein (TIGR03437 family)